MPARAATACAQGCDGKLEPTGHDMQPVDPPPALQTFKWMFELEQVQHGGR
jgi:hypothetical protein